MGYALAAVVAIVVFANAPAFGQSLDPRISTIELACGGSAPSVQTTVAEISTGQCDSATEGSSAFSIAEAYLGTSTALPEVFSETYASAYGTATSATAKSTANLQFRINSTSPPPVAIAAVPVYSYVYGETDLYGNSIGSASLTLAGPGYDSGSVLALFPPNLNNVRVTADIQPGSIYTVGLAASCYSVAAAIGGVSHCQSVMDPGIFFDQAALNAMLGANSFDLSNYYSIQVSSVVPIPGSVWLFVSGAFGLAGVALRRRIA